LTLCALDRFFVGFDETKVEKPDGFRAFAASDEIAFEEITDFDDDRDSDE
jgi:hypothetical protein